MRLDESGLLTRIEDSTLDGIKPAHEILQRIWSRSLYHKLITVDISKTSTSCPAELRETDDNEVLQHFMSTSNVSEEIKAYFSAFKTTIVTGMTGQKVIRIYSPHVTYRVRHHLSDLGWVRFNANCSTICQVLLGLMGNWQNWMRK